MQELPGIIDNLKKLAELNYINASLIAVSLFSMRLIQETKMQKVLKRIGSLPPLPEEDKFDIKKRAADILKSWQPFLDEIIELTKKDEEVEAMEDVESAEKLDEEKEDAEEKPDEENEDVAEPAEETVEEKAEEKPAETQPEEKSEAMDTSADVAEDFVMVESGGEVDERAQEKATVDEQQTNEEGDSGAGAKGSEPAPEESGEPMGIPSSYEN